MSSMVQCPIIGAALDPMDQASDGSRGAVEGCGANGPLEWCTVGWTGGENGGIEEAEMIGV